MKPSQRYAFNALIGLVWSIIGVVIIFDLSPLIYANILIIMTIVSIVAYQVDKRQAQAKGWRIPEFVLHWFALSGGMIGALAGMLFFRHKTQKRPFWIVIGVSFLLHAGFIYLILG